MSDPAAEVKVTAASDIEVDREALDSSIKEFVEENGDYYVDAFHKIHDNTGIFPKTFNKAAALAGPIWAASKMRGTAAGRVPAMNGMMSGGN